MKILYNKKKITWPLVEKRILSSCVENISHSLPSLTRKIYCQLSKLNSVSPHSHVISSMNLKQQKYCGFSNDVVLYINIPGKLNHKIGNNFKFNSREAEILFQNSGVSEMVWPKEGPAADVNFFLKILTVHLENSFSRWRCFKDNFSLLWLDLLSLAFRISISTESFFSDLLRQSL